MLISRLSPFLPVVLSLLFPKTASAWDILFSNKAYSKNIIVQTQFATKETIGKLIDDSKDDLSSIPRETNSDLQGKTNYLFVRIKNFENMSAWGKLSCSINDRRPIEIDIPSLASNMSYWNHYVITFGGIIFPTKSEKNGIPKIECSWDQLYAK